MLKRNLKKNWNQFCRGINFAMYWDHVGIRISQNWNFEVKYKFKIKKNKMKLKITVIVVRET